MLLRPTLARLALGSSILCTVAACGDLGVDGNGQRVTETRPVTPFSNVVSRSSLDVRIARGDAFAVSVSIDSNLLSLVSTQINGPTLTIDVDGGIGRVVAGPQVMVTMPTLGFAGLSGSGRLAAATFSQADPVDLAVDGSGELSFVGDVPAARVRSSGSGETRLAGTAPTLAVAVDGSGAVDARNLTATTADLSVGGSGDLAAMVTGSARVAISGSGAVDLFGGAALESIDVSGSGALRRH
jgi:hypothetical protein